MTGLIIRPVAASDASAWRALWQGYLDFYDAADLPAETTAATWARILDPDSPVKCTVAVLDDDVAGFAVTVMHPGTWTTRPLCYLEDLFVNPAARGRGIGRTLIAALAEQGRREGWEKLYWQTHKENVRAQKLYETLCPQTDWRRYDYDL